jgi:hypothetical protein
MRKWPAVLVTLTTLLAADAARAQEGPRNAQPGALPQLPATAQPAPAPQAATSAPPMVAVTPADTAVDCATAVGDPRCRSVQLTQPTMARKPKPRTRWYGWQTLITDGAAFAMLVGAGATSNNENSSGALLAASGLTYALGGPIVHWAHLHGGIGAASLGLRLGLPVGLGLVGLAIGSAVGDGKDYAGIAGAALGFVVGFPAAIALDAAVLAREDVEDEAPDAQARLKKLQRPWFVVHPDVQTSRTGAQVGVRGMF